MLSSASAVGGSVISPFYTQFVNVALRLAGKQRHDYL
jgi:hypothetical protein